MRLILLIMLRWWSLMLFLLEWKGKMMRQSVYYLKDTFSEWSSFTTQLTVSWQSSRGRNSLRRRMRLLLTLLWLKSLPPSTVLGLSSLSGPQYHWSELETGGLTLVWRRGLT